MATSKPRPGTDEIGITDEDLKRLERYQETRHPASLLGPGDSYGATNPISPRLCTKLRYMVSMVGDATSIAGHQDIDPKTARQHIRGECQCDGPTPPRLYQNNSWVAQGPLNRFVNDTECAALRAAIEVVGSAADISRGYGRTQDTIRHHALGHCHCQPEEPPRRFDGDDWVTTPGASE